MVFGRKKNKIEFDARYWLPKEVKENPNEWEYVHNFKVHYKRGALQVIATKQDISIPSKSPTLPSFTEVTAFAETRILASFEERKGIQSFHITNIEYKESIALRHGGW